MKQSGFVLVGAGKRAFLVAEKLALHEVLRDGAAIDGDEWRFTARTLQVDQPCRQLLAAAGLTADVDRCLASCQLFYHLPHLAYCRGYTDHVEAAEISDLGVRQFERGLHQRTQLAQ